LSSSALPPDACHNPATATAAAAATIIAGLAFNFATRLIGSLLPWISSDLIVRDSVLTIDAFSVTFGCGHSCRHLEKKSPGFTPGLKARAS
jgi:hypothetical protein